MFIYRFNLPILRIEIIIIPLIMPFFSSNLIKKFEDLSFSRYFLLVLFLSALTLITTFICMDIYGDQGCQESNPTHKVSFEQGHLEKLVYKKILYIFPILAILYTFNSMKRINKIQNHKMLSENLSLALWVFYFLIPINQYIDSINNIWVLLTYLL
jgi:hypothetical protein